MGVLGYLLTGKISGHLVNPKTADVAKKGATEGMVLLKNDGILPLKEKCVALYGAGALDTFYCGTGSGYVFSPYITSVYDGLKNKGVEITSLAWLKEYKKEKKAAEKAAPKISFFSKRWSGLQFVYSEKEIEDSYLTSAQKAKTAIYVIHRTTGESFDRKAEAGDYYLSETEKTNIRKIGKAFNGVVVVLNAVQVDGSFLENEECVRAVVLMGEAGLEGGNALADLLFGDASFSGRLTDTWAKTYEDYPACKTFSANDGITTQEDYSEGIYVGYRYFDSFHKEVIYPFGYGLSYSEFEISDAKASHEGSKVTVFFTVKNVGKMPSKEVIQLYVSAPNGRLAKSYQELKGFTKTDVLQPGEGATLSISFDIHDCASFDETLSAFILEKGKYLLRLGENSRKTEVIGAISLEEEIVAKKVTDCLHPDKEIEVLKADPFDFGNYEGETLFLTSSDIETIDEISRIEKEIVSYVNKGSDYKIANSSEKFAIPCQERIEVVDEEKDSTLVDVYQGKVSLKSFVASLDVETLLRLVTGKGQETKYEVPSRFNKKFKGSLTPMQASGKTTSLFESSLGIPATSLCDGPAGLHLLGLPATAFPVGMVYAQSWNTELAKEIGDCFGIEMEAYHLNIILGPGMNIHRDPLCGRCFEYFSEDPFISGKMAAGFTLGVQTNHPGYGVSMKHFFGNNQELDRITSNDTIPLQAVREIYLRGFEIGVKESKPMTVMSSYNLVNGIHTSSRYDLITDVLRGEWGFDGYVMTDWDSASDKVTDLYAGNDIIMGGYQTVLLKSAFTGEGPEFDEFGSVKQITTTAYGGFFKKTLTYWNAFIPDKDGKDHYDVTVPADKKLSENIDNFVKEGYCSVKENPDGSHTVTYVGNNQGAILPLGVLQRNAMRVLTQDMNMVNMKQIIDNSK